MDLKINKDDINLIADKICNNICEGIEKNITIFEKKIVTVLETHIESLTDFQSKTIRKLNNELSPITNLYMIFRDIETDKRINAEEFVKEEFEKKGFEVRREPICDSRYKNIDRVGRPDFTIYPVLDSKTHTYSNYPFFVEVKTNGDGLKMNQLEWIKKYTDLKVICFCLKQKINSHTKAKASS